MKVRFKNKILDRVYQYFIDKTPDDSWQVQSLLHRAFLIGYKGLPRPKWALYNTQAYAAYVAGKETRKIQKR